jgi:diguanylate cyclase (GGDEF)-like protein
LSNSTIDQVFSFESHALPMPAIPAEEVDQPIEPAGKADLDKALQAAGEAAYQWVVASDVIHWSDHAAAVLGCATSAVPTGKRFAGLLDSDNMTSRYETVMRNQTRDNGDGVPFRIEYQFRSEGRGAAKSVWIEDQGRWYAGTDGRPREVYGTIRRIDDRHRRDQHLNFLGNCDPLTGMMNRGRMTEALGEAISVATREHGQSAFAIAAVNNLPVVNEAYGFEVADEVIVALGRRLRQVMRAGDGIARFSGGKFGIILNNCDEKELQTALDRFLAVVRDSVIETQHGPVWAMLSIGALCLPAQAGDAHLATARAEEALNEARRQPSDAYVIYKPSTRRSDERKLNARCATEIVHCLKTDRFKLAFQPLVSAKTGETVMHEALLRMSDGDTGELIAASHLVPVSERLGLVRLIDRAVTQMIINTLHSYPDANLSMNVSATTATDPRWYNQLLEMISTNSDVAERLTVEITETTVMSDIDSTRQFVESLRTAGCGVAIDDFGAGYTSFRNLRDLPVNMIKLDGSFCQNLKANSENEYIVRSLIDLGRKFNLKTVAEWVEHEEDAEALRDWGIDYLQGHFFGEASIVAPWKLNDSSTFILTPPHSVIISSLEQNIVVEEDLVALESVYEAAEVETELALIVEVSQPEPEAIIVVAEPEALLNMASEDVSEDSTPITEDEPQSPDEDLSFTDIDESITSLKATLGLLREHFPVVPEPAMQVEQVA